MVPGNDCCIISEKKSSQSCHNRQRENYITNIDRRFHSINLSIKFKLFFYKLLYKQYQKRRSPVLLAYLFIFRNSLKQMIGRKSIHPGAPIFSRSKSYSSRIKPSQQVISPIQVPFSNHSTFAHPNSKHWPALLRETLSNYPGISLKLVFQRIIYRFVVPTSP